MTEQISLVPKRRFKEFQSSHPWKTINLKEIVNLLKDGTHGTHQDGNYAFLLSAKNIKNGQIIIDEVNDRKILSKDYNLIFKNYKLIDQDLLVTIVGTIGQTALYKESTLRVAFQRSVAIIRGDKHVNQNFLKYTIDSSYTQKQLKQSASMSAQAGVYLGDLEKLKLYIPEFTEQIKIGLFLRQLDDLITIQQRKLDKTKSLKVAYLSEMFPAEGELSPKRRCTGFTQDWVQCKWINSVNISTDMVDPKSGKYDGLLHIGPGNIESFSGQLYNNVRTVKEDNLISGKFHFHKGDIIYGKINPQLGKYIYAPFEGLSSADAYVLNAKDGFDQTFLFALIQTQHFFKYSVSVSMRSGMPKINRDELNEFEFKVPNLHEQKRIGELFLQLDALISLQQRKLEKLQNLKKAYLHEMFV
ncbi:hypothetical protein ASF99_13645 [Exiguobacterium sp. Leaf187]|uniref:restriction endonuclease subunit S n=1 Tax=Exiguobacterium TaxID=33986 RepID=UPI0007017C03|nr:MULTISPECIES: restriction endonuclease subunit S [Exiguobacterium]KQS23543.1 hypothetical protein ASF99_13645 [Exiguobacterium sp. Leaf187]